MTAVNAIEFRHVTKTYYIQKRASPRLGAWAVNKLFEHLRREPFDALHNVTLDVPRGQMLGILGTNGAGKSTVLKLTAGIMQPTTGTVRTRGRIASMLELGVGFHPELSGMENIFYNGIMMGMTREDIHERLERIIEFSGLRKFLYEPVKHYSSGMYARLACSVALHVDPDIILVDEILAVGDSEFQQRGLGRILELHDEGATILVVTHVLTAARDTCERLIWIEHGKILEDGPAPDVVQRYRHHVLELSMPGSHFLSRKRPVVAEVPDGERAERGLESFTGKDLPRLAAMRLENGNGQTVDRLSTGETARLVFEVDGDRARVPYRLQFCVRWPDGRRLFEDQTDVLAPGAGGPIVYEVDSWPLLRGRHLVSAALVTDGEPGVVLDRRIDGLEFHTHTDEVLLPMGNVVFAPMAEWSVQ